MDLEVPRSHYDGNELLDIAITGKGSHDAESIVKISIMKELCRDLLRQSRSGFRLI